MSRKPASCVDKSSPKMVSVKMEPKLHEAVRICSSFAGMSMTEYIRDVLAKETDKFLKGLTKEKIYAFLDYTPSVEVEE